MKGRKATGKQKLEKGPFRGHIVPSIILSVMYFTYRASERVSARAQGSRDVNGRRKVENEERKGDRTERGSVE